ncbi:protein of unknown function [Paraburkholderia dioscoreae]|uniref:Uncharacterized protein n=1 Tax=Paraburkholderia dioscoreae TaxID=2604047 RepID=A0A5Q4ZGF7_9BURK|nr:protein of unknown function [Paraburkholderia dioscoreae]
MVRRISSRFFGVVLLYDVCLAIEDRLVAVDARPFESFSRDSHYPDVLFLDKLELCLRKD